MIAAWLMPVARQIFRTDRGPSTERNYLCTFLNDQGERVDVFENSGGTTFFLVHRRGAETTKGTEFLKVA